MALHARRRGLSTVVVDGSLTAIALSQAFGEGHGKQPEGQRPVSTQAELLSFEVVDLS